MSCSLRKQNMFSELINLMMEEGHSRSQDHVSSLSVENVVTVEEGVLWTMHKLGSNSSFAVF